MTNVQRAGITTVGTFCVTPRGLEPQGWQFVFAGDLPGGVTLDFEAGQIAGWTLSALHAVAHGTPCVAGEGCPLPVE